MAFWQQCLCGKSQLPVHLALITAQVLSGFYFVITALALSDGMNRFVLSFYSMLVAVVFLIPLAYFMDKNHRPLLTFDVLFKLFLLGFTGMFGIQFLGLLGLEYTSAEFSALMQPLVPALTVLMALVFGLERIHWFRRDGQAKITGIIVCLTGAVLITLYRGPVVFGEPEASPSISVPTTETTSTSTETTNKLLSLLGFVKISGWNFGVLCLLGNAVFMASFVNLQVPLVQTFSAPATMMAFTCGFGAILMGIAGIFAVDKPSDWVLAWDKRLCAIVYNGMIASALNFAIMTWCIKRVGPLLVASYIPIQPVASAALALVFLGSNVHLGSILGTAVIFLGLLPIAWSQEEGLRLASIEFDLEANLPVESLEEPLLSQQEQHTSCSSSNSNNTYQTFS